MHNDQKYKKVLEGNRNNEAFEAPMYELSYMDSIRLKKGKRGEGDAR
jgi:hypothetical protein